MNHFTTETIAHQIQKGAFTPHQYLSNLCLNYFQNAQGFVSTKLFPIVTTALSTSYYYEFNKGDLARDNMARKPELGAVAPALFGYREQQYKCHVDQVITGISKISALDFERASGGQGVDPRRVKARFIAEQMTLHQDILWASKYFNPQSWGTVYQGVDSTPAEGQFLHFNEEGSDPVQFIHQLSTKMALSGLRRPNKMCLGANVLASLKSNPCILERIKYQGSEANPANVTSNVLAQLFGLDEVLVSETVYNAATLGEEDDLNFVCDPNDALLVYVTDMPSLEEPSAGYTFAWDMLGNGNYTPVIHFEGAPETHSEYVEGLLATDHQITCQDLGVYLADVVSPDFTL